MSMRPEMDPCTERWPIGTSRFRYNSHTLLFIVIAGKHAACTIYVTVNHFCSLDINFVYFVCRQSVKLRSQQNIKMETVFGLKLKVHEFKWPWTCPLSSNHEIVCPCM